MDPIYWILIAVVAIILVLLIPKVTTDNFAPVNNYYVNYTAQPNYDESNIYDNWYQPGIPYTIPLRNTRGMSYDLRGDPIRQRRRNFLWNNSDRAAPIINRSLASIS